MRVGDRIQIGEQPPDAPGNLTCSLCGGVLYNVKVHPDVAIPNPGMGTYKPLQLRIFKKLRVTEDLTLREVPVLSGNANSRLPKVPPCLRRSGFAQAGARLWENTRRIVRRLPGEAAQYPRPVSILFFATGGFIED